MVSTSDLLGAKMALLSTAQILSVSEISRSLFLAICGLVNL